MGKREKPPEDPPEDIPFWFITYSDVITLLMTFFILLLTFATNEPEAFDRMQSTLAGGGNADGIAGLSDGQVKDSIVARMRPRAARVTNRGTETAPRDRDPVYSSMSLGLEGLEDPLNENPTVSHAVNLPLALIVSEDQTVTALGHQRMRMFAAQLRKSTYSIVLQVANKQDLPRAMALAQSLILQHGITPGKIGVGTLDEQDTKGGGLRLTLTRRTR